MQSVALESSSARGGVPRWLLPLTTLGTAVLIVAVHWDFSWHRSIGRDTFFTPPHVLLYSGALFSCLAAGAAIVRSRFVPATNGGVHLCGFEAPLGAFVVAWGGLTLLAGGIFDDWWHGVYGLDIVIQSVPHVVIAVGGLFTICCGNLLVASSHANTSADGTRPLVVIAGGLLLTLVLQVNLEELFVYLMHGARFYCIVTASVPFVVFGVGRTVKERFAATRVTLVYTGLTLALLFLLPLVPAEPRLGPILHPIRHFVPPPFPLLLLPAVALADYTAPRFAGRSSVVQSALAGTIFFAAFALMQWPFASFLQTHYADNRLFVGNEFAFFQAETSYPVRRLFYPTESTPGAFLVGMLFALGLAVVSTGAGLAAARWLREVRR